MSITKHSLYMYHLYQLVLLVSTCILVYILLILLRRSSCSFICIVCIYMYPFLNFYIYICTIVRLCPYRSTVYTCTTCIYLYLYILVYLYICLHTRDIVIPCILVQAFYFRLGGMAPKGKLTAALFQERYGNLVSEYFAQYPHWGGFLLR